MLAEIDITTVVACLVNTNAFLAVVLLVYWATQRVYAGFGLWAIGTAAAAISYVFFAFREDLPGLLPFVVAPFLMVLAAVFRLESLRRHLGRERFDFRM